MMTTEKTGTLRAERFLKGFHISLRSPHEVGYFQHTISKASLESLIRFVIKAHAQPREHTIEQSRERRIKLQVKGSLAFILIKERGQEEEIIAIGSLTHLIAQAQKWQRLL